MLEGDVNIKVLEWPVACPFYQGVYPIVEVLTLAQNKLVALEGMKTACGAVLIASQTSLLIDG